MRAGGTYAQSSAKIKKEVRNMFVKIAILVVFFAVMILVGVRARKKVTGVSDFVMGGRSIGPWMTAFSYGTSYFSAVVFIGYA